MTVLEKAKELAQAIAECDELKEVRAAETRMTLDPDAQDILREFQIKQREFYNIQVNGGELTEEQKRDVERIENRMSQNEYIRKFVGAQERFEALLNSVNMIIAQAISGNSGCGCGDNGAADCCDSGCSGCN
ncbi:hypothetical protein Tfer_0512 [Thermincola ferriacetica]|uniref:YlbF family regulator n=1 Tax=Thermincola ferriacetica TaxID=281456 RepID=A0A0L6W5H3_9FIRM|nr:YlbF family regulator [Thermincola ferriacetica]KNZ70832.1 hypothetical protein Tfer_0512 [Thermincola ferriacetica]